jgi:hypothetical protein
MFVWAKLPKIRMQTVNSLLKDKSIFRVPGNSIYKRKGIYAFAMCNKPLKILKKPLKGPHSKKISF